MSSYLLLRDNQELGPYSLRELEVLPLKRDDLVWVTDRSTGWERPENVPELNAITASDAIDNLINPRISDDKDRQASFYIRSYQGEETRSENTVPAAYYRNAPAGSAGFYSDAAETPAKESFLSRFAWVFVFAAILLTAFFLTKMVTGSDKMVMPKKVIAAAPKEVLDNTENFQNALTREFVFVPDSSRTPKKTKPKDIRKQVDITNNDYRVGLFGGINDLELTIENNSDQRIDKITIQVDYLKPNGDVISSEVISATEIKPNRSKKVSVPSSSRGVKIKHKVLEIKSHDFKPAMSEI